jgi:hypothetical protein
MRLTGEGAFLTNPVIGHSSDCRICVGFQYDYERGTLGNRNGWTDRNPLETATTPAFDLHLGPSIWVTWTDSHSAAKIRKQVPVSHLRPARPSSKNQEVLVLKEGHLFGTRGTIEKAKRKEGSAVVIFRGSGLKETFSMSDLCKVCTTDPFTT